MAGSPPKPTFDQHGRFIDTESGLVVPESYAFNANIPANHVAFYERTISTKGFNHGYIFDRDEDTLAVKYPRKGSGIDDLISQAIVDGMVANVGVSPVIAPQISGMVRRQAYQASTATIDVTGRPTPVSKARDAIAMFDDSPLGVTAALETMVYRLCTYNRGSPIATIPILYSMEDWDSFGMIAHPILARKNSNPNRADKYWLEVDWSRFGTPVPFLPHPFDLEPTGNVNFPYWYHATREDGSRPWVLLSNDQIVPLLPGKSGKAGIGMSSVWMCLGYLAEQILVTDERIEKLLYGYADGIILLGGVDELEPKDILTKEKEARKEAKETGFSVSKGTTILTSPTNQVSVAQITLRQPPGVEFQEWREWAEDIISFSFGETLSALVIRGGVGYGVQSDTASDNAADMGVGALLNKIGSALGSIYPRVVISTARTNDRAARLNIRTLAQFASASHSLIADGVFNAEMSATIIDRDILPLPEAGDVTTSANAEDAEETPEAGSEAGGKSGDAQDGQSSQDGKTQQPAGKSTPPQTPTKASAEGAQITPATLRIVQGAILLGEMMERQRAEHNALLGTLAETGDVSITDEDVDAALQLAKERVGQDVFDLLTAKPVEE